MADRALELLLDSVPVLTRISAAKRLRDAVETDAKKAGESTVTAARVASSSSMTGAHVSPAIGTNGTNGTNAAAGPPRTSAS
jgi:hypothetical protein